MLVRCVFGPNWIAWLVESEHCLNNSWRPFVNLCKFPCSDSGDSGNLRLIRRDPGDNAGLRVRDQCKLYFVHLIPFNFRLV